MEKMIDDNPKVKLVASKNGGVYAAAVRYKTGIGKDVRVAFSWREKQQTSGHYADLVDNYVDVKVKKRAFLYAQTVYSEKKKVGYQLWMAYEGSKDKGHQSFDESMHDEELFARFDDKSPLKPFLVDARKKVAEALEEHYKQLRKEQQMQLEAAYKSR